MVRFLFSVLLVVGSISIRECNGQEVLQPSDFYQGMLDNRFDAILDVRTQQEWDAGHIANVTLVQNLASTGLPDDIVNCANCTVAVHCRSGSRAAAAIARLQSEFGFSEEHGGKLYNCLGVSQWTAAGFPLGFTDSVEPECATEGCNSPTVVAGNEPGGDSDTTMDNNNNTAPEFEPDWLLLEGCLGGLIAAAGEDQQLNNEQQGEILSFVQAQIVDQNDSDCALGESETQAIADQLAIAWDEHICNVDPPDECSIPVVSLVGRASSPIAVERLPAFQLFCRFAKATLEAACEESSTITTTTASPSAIPISMDQVEGTGAPGSMAQEDTSTMSPTIDESSALAARGVLGTAGMVLFVGWQSFLWFL